MKNLFYICILLFLGILGISSCTRTVYSHSDEVGSSRFVIYKENYFYKEQTPNTHFKISGKYALNDSTIVFDLKEKDRIPYHYFNKNIHVIQSNQGLDYLTITIVEKGTDTPFPFATIKARQKEQVVFEDLTGLDGKIQIPKKEEFQSIEIEYVGIPKHVIFLSKYKNKDLRIEIEELKQGGRRSETCPFNFMDVLLEYKIPQKGDFDFFERSGVVFKRQ